MWCPECLHMRDDLRAALLEAKLGEAVRIASAGAVKMIGDALGLDERHNRKAGDLRETLPSSLQGGSPGRSKGSDTADG